MRTRIHIATLTVSAAAAAGAASPTLAGGPTRNAVTDGLYNPGPLDLTTPAWIFPASDPSVPGPIRFNALATPVVAERFVYALSLPLNGTPAQLHAIDRSTGRRVWFVDVPTPNLDSWSSPTIDRGNATILVASGEPGPNPGSLAAYRLTDGEQRWRTDLAKDIVNATPLVTTDRGPADRAFITDYEGFYTGGGGGSIFCINVDPVDADENPFAPGEIVWRLDTGAALSGATPAYDGTRVYIATAGDSLAANGSVLALDPAATAADDALLWETTAGGDDAFFAAVSVDAGFVYAATYTFTGGTDSARLVKIDAGTGDLVWSVPSNRTSSIPIVIGGDVWLSTGIPGFGSVPTLQRFHDLGDSALLTFDSAADTPLSLAGWTHQPHVVGTDRIYVGTMQTAGSPGLFASYDRLSLIDLNALPSTTAVLSIYDGAGGSPSVAENTLYTLNDESLVAFGVPCRGDVLIDGIANIFDLLAFLPNPDITADRTLDGVVDAGDTIELITAIEAGCP